MRSDLRIVGPLPLGAPSLAWKSGDSPHPTAVRNPAGPKDQHRVPSAGDSASPRR